MSEAKYPSTHAELDAIASANGIAVNAVEPGSNAKPTWGDGSIKTVDEKQAELEARGISAREALNIEAFTVKAAFSTVYVNVPHLDETIVLENGKPYETSDANVIAALVDHPSVKRVGEAELEELDGAAGNG